MTSRRDEIDQRWLGALCAYQPSDSLRPEAVLRTGRGNPIALEGIMEIGLRTGVRSLQQKQMNYRRRTSLRGKTFCGSGDLAASTSCPRRLASRFSSRSHRGAAPSRAQLVRAS
jgi:hypothetical protein